MFGLHFFQEGQPHIFFGGLLGPFTSYRLAKFDRVPFGDLRVRTLAMEQNG